jgi:hypothetical protein
MIAAMQIAEYVMPVNSAIMKAAAPITGGTMLPPFDAVASIAAAMTGLKPLRIMIGMVTDPVVITSATGLPDTEPNKPDDTTATFAEPPAWRPLTDAASR